MMGSSLQYVRLTFAHPGVREALWKLKRRGEFDVQVDELYGDAAQAVLARSPFLDTN